MSVSMLAVHPPLPECKRGVGSDFVLSLAAAPATRPVLQTQVPGAQE